MNQLLILFLVTIYTSSKVFGNEQFSELDISSECFPPNFADPDYPTCSFLISANAINKVKQECIQDTDLSPPALRIIGEFRILKIICTASFPIDFRYYGIQPTEAMMIDWYKGVQPNSKKSNQNFTAEVKIYSVQELFEFYSNVENSNLEKPETFVPPQTVHDYSRTGNYEFHGMYNKSTLGTSFYIFLEDGAKPSFLRNPKTVPKILENDFFIPCIPSHFDSEVEMTKVPSSVFRSNVNIVRSPIDGFIFKYNGSEITNFYGSYECVLKHKGLIVDKIHFEFNANTTEIPDKLFGLENFNFENGDKLEVSLEPIRQGNYLKYVKPFCKTKSPLDPVDRSKLTLISVPMHNFAHVRLVQQFANPKFVNQSYSARMFNISTGDMSEYTSIAQIIKQPGGQIFTSATLYCTTGYSEKYLVIGMTIRGLSVVVDYALDWMTLDLKSIDGINFFGVNILNTSSLFAGTVSSFACKILPHILFKPIVWYTEHQNGTRVEEKIDYDLVGDTATWNANLSVDVRKVICAVSFWNSAEWIETSVDVALQEIDEPVINQVETTRNLQSGSKGTTLECTAWGNPKPSVYFEKDGLRLPSLPSGNGTIIVFDKIESSNAGTYTCVANNGKETRQDFIINVTTAEFDPLVVVIPVIVFFLTAIAFAVYIKFFRPVKTGLTQEEINEFLEGLKKEQIPDGDEKYAHGFASMTSYKTEYEIAPHRFIVDENRILGSGAFGIVKPGEVDHKTVAVKTTQKHAEKQYLKALLSELKIMIYLGSHPNLVQIIGAYTKDLKKGIVYVFVEYVSRGNLQSYLRNNKDVPGNEYVNSNQSVGQIIRKSEYKNTSALTKHSFLQWARQIANGMDYLGSKQVIHGDLATRNVLLDDNLNVKITDFGLSRQLYEYHDYIKKEQAPLPWRWLALESLKYMTFSHASDVWAFGVTIWEIYSLGEIPYPGYTWTMDFVKELEKGMRMQKPKYGSDNLYGILSQCWHEDPKQRPSFKELKLQLDELDVSDYHSQEI